MYGEPFAIPAPEELIFISSFAGGEVFRGGCTWTRGAGRIFYFSPGDQDYPVYHHPDIKRVLANGGAVGGAAAAHDRVRQPAVAGGVVAMKVGVVGRRLGRPAAHRRLRRARRRRAGRDRRARGRRARAARRRARRPERLRALGGPARARRPGGDQRRRPDLPARADRRGRARTRAARALREADRAQRRAGGRDGRAPRAAPAGCSTSPSTTAAAATSSGCGRRSRPAASGARTTRRRGGCAAPASRRSARGSRAPSWRAAGRWSTSACTCSTTRSSCSATRACARSAPRPTTCSARNGFGGSGELRQVRRRRRRDVRRRGPRDGLHAPRRRRHAAAGGELGRPPRRRRPVRRHALRHRGRGRVVSSTTTPRSAR